MGAFVLRRRRDESRRVRPRSNLVAHSAALASTERFQAYFEIAPHRREDASLGTLQYDVPISHLSPEQCAAELRKFASS